jgi:hypothetical protein
VDYFQAVAVFERRFGSAGAGDYFAVEFDGYAVGLHGEGFHQGCECQAGGSPDGALFTI